MNGSLREIFSMPLNSQLAKLSSHCDKRTFLKVKCLKSRMLSKLAVIKLKATLEHWGKPNRHIVCGYRLVHFLCYNYILRSNCMPRRPSLLFLNYRYSLGWTGNPVRKTSYFREKIDFAFIILYSSSFNATLTKSHVIFLNLCPRRNYK